jgi:hypothetical protein
VKDLKSVPLMLTKAAVFVVIAALCAAGLLLESPRISTGILIQKDLTNGLWKLLRLPHRHR